MGRIYNGTHTLRNDSLLYLSIATDVYSWLNKDPSYQELQKINLANFQKQPSFFLVKIDKSTEIAQNVNTTSVDESDAKLDELFQANQAFLLALPLECDMAYYRTTGPFGGRYTYAQSTWKLQYRPGYRPGEEHSRAYICGTDKSEISLTDTLSNVITMTTLRSGENF